VLSRIWWHLQGLRLAVSHVEVKYQMSARHARQASRVGTIDTSLSGTESGAGCASANAIKGTGSERMRFRYRRLTAMLVREGMLANHKRVYRLYREEGLAMRIRQRRRIRCSGAAVRPVASQPNQRWSMDFVSDCVSTDTVIRMLTIVDDCTRGCPAIEVDTSLGELRVRRVLDRIASEEDSRTPLFWTTDRSFAAGHWRLGARNMGCAWS